MHLLIVLYMGDVQFTKICIDDAMARIELADWCIDNWLDDDADPGDFSADDMIEWYFDNYEDYSYYRQPIQVPKPGVLTQGEDIILTPGMCAIIRHGLGQVQYGHAATLLEQHNEVEDGTDAGLAAQNVVGEILDQFE